MDTLPAWFWIPADVFLWVSYLVLKVRDLTG